MKTTDATVNITSPGRNFVTLKIETDEGIYAPGDGALNGCELALARRDIKDQARAAKYPYQRACLPINRKLDGTLTNW
jgi:L-alanine-DL-glutamate epimerase-like enolase superfamily enzyme